MIPQTPPGFDRPQGQAELAPSELMLHAAIDGELDPVNALAVEQQIASNPALAAEHARILTLRRALQERLPATEMPAGLEQRVRTAVGLAARQRTVSWRAMAASIILAMLVSSGATWMVTRTPPADDAIEFVMANHLRALMAPKPFDIASSDRHVVRPWFNGRIPQAPRVADLRDAGFDLIGGRVDVVGQNGVPTLVYQTRLHVISLTAVPDTAQRSTKPTLTTMRGYSVIRWNANDVAYSAVSDLNATELRAFVQAFRDTPPDR